MGIMTVNFFGVDVESVSHLWHNATHGHEKFSEKEKPRGLVNPGVVLEETSVKELATAITSEKSI